MIADYEDEGRDFLLDAPRQYALAQQHKHLREMKKISGLMSEPIFCPIVSSFYSGMTVTVPLFASQLNSGKTVEDIKKAYAKRYANDVVRYVDSIDDNGFLSAHIMSDKDSMRITVCGNEDRRLLVSTYDNLGQGASGSGVECMNMVLGANRTEGLVL